MSHPRRTVAHTTEASRVFDALRDPKPIDGGWSSLCPKHGSLIYVRVQAGRLRSIRCAVEDCPEVERLKRIAAQ